MLRYDRYGHLSDRVLMPVPRPTSCCFGGKGVGTLFITTVCFAMTPKEVFTYSNAGDLYAITPRISGNPRYLFKA
ncbi:SMP-30/gluconolactonase/LRE family protein [Lelliottia amnigena]